MNSLPKEILKYMLSFTKEGHWRMVCKLWKNIYDNNIFSIKFLGKTKYNLLIETKKDKSIEKRKYISEPLNYGVGNGINTIKISCWENGYRYNIYTKDRIIRYYQNGNFNVTYRNNGNSNIDFFYVDYSLLPDAKWECTLDMESYMQELNYSQEIMNIFLFDE
jgi:hypothetical protein